MSYQDPVNHRAMVLDDYRNGYYFEALKKVVTPESVVLDLGAGLGILGLLAASLGAKKVYLVEPATDLNVAREIARSNGLENVVEFLPCTIEKAKLAEQVDIILSVFTGNFLLEEDLLPSLFVARDKYLKPGGTLIPDRAVMYIVPVDMQGYYDEHILSWQQPRVIDHGAMTKYAANRLYFDNFERESYQRLAEPVLLHHIDFMTAKLASCTSDIELVALQGGQLHGFLGWFDMKMGDQWLSTGPDAPATHWRQAYLPVHPAVAVATGERLSLRVQRPESGEWSWRVQTDRGGGQYSTFLGRANSVVELSLRSKTYVPVLGEAGRVTAALLVLIDGQTTAEELAETLFLGNQDFFVDRVEALEFVQQQIKRFCHE